MKIKKIVTSYAGYWFLLGPGWDCDHEITYLPFFGHLLVLFVSSYGH